MSVLVDSSIRARFTDIFPFGGDTENIRAAKYYLTLGEDLLFLPGGDDYPPGHRRKRSFALSPGQSAVVSTEERVHMPDDLVGIIGSRFENSDRGLLFFGGMIVDPGYGRGDGCTSEEAPGERLILTIANVGNRTIELRPGEDFIASIAFLELEEKVSKASLNNYFVARPALDLGIEKSAADGYERPFRPLGFVEELEDVKLRLDKVHASTTQVVLFGVIVLSVTLCAAIVGATFEASGHFEAKESLARSLGLTLGVVFAGVILATGLFYAWLGAVVWRRGLNRTVILKRSSD
jgi:hypothetical protein